MSFTSTNANEGAIMNQAGEGFNVNKNVIIGVLALVVVILAGVALWSTMNNRAKPEIDAKIYQYETTVLEKLNKNPQDKAAAAEVLAAFKNLQSANKSYVGLFPALLVTADKLTLAGDTAGAIDLLENGMDSAHNSYAKFFLLSRLAALYEDANNTDKAIEALTKMTSNDAKVFEGKIYLDLGRLNLAKGNKEEAKKHFTHVVEKANQDAEFVKIAKIYLEDLKN